MSMFAPTVRHTLRTMSGTSLKNGPIVDKRLERVLTHDSHIEAPHEEFGRSKFAFVSPEKLRANQLKADTTSFSYNKV